MEMSKPIFYIESPLVKCSYPSVSECFNAFIKLENLQPSGSFKDRGISCMINSILKTDKIKKLVSSSGGNAGHAVATAGRTLGIPVDVFVPITTKPMMIAKLKRKGANVFVHGANWNEADKMAREEVAKDDHSYYIPPYDDPRIWEGHSTIIDEIASSGIVPDKIIVSVGGGGLLCGIQRGILRHGWQDRTKVVAVETEGAASFAASSTAGKLVSLTGITSIASSLGALSVTSACLDSGVSTISLVVPDKAAVTACRRFADEFNMLVEPACGAALSYLYCPQSERVESVDVNEDENKNKEKAKETVVVIACGGSVVNIELLAKWCADFNVESEYA